MLVPPALCVSVSCPAAGPSQIAWWLRCMLCKGPALESITNAGQVTGENPNTGSVAKGKV